MTTATELLRASLEAVREKFVPLLEKSSITHRHPRATPGIVVLGPTGRWGDLDAQGQQAQALLLEDYRTLASIIRTLLRTQPADAHRAFEDANKVLLEVIEQDSRTWLETIDDASAKVTEALGTISALLDRMPDRGEGLPIYVPDANALIQSPALDNWAFDGARRFEVVLTATLLGELDDLKMTYRVEEVRRTAESVINRIKEYGRRGDLHAGVALRRDRSTIRMLAVEPDFGHTLPWLDPAVKDDRLVAETIEVIRRHPRSPVAIVTADINLQNKARLARVPFVEPPHEGRRPAKHVPPRSTKHAESATDIRILDLKPTGGSSGSISFVAEVQNYGTRPARVSVRATVAGEAVDCRPATLDLLVNQPLEPVRIQVPRPRLGDLVPELNSEPTLYGQPLRVELSSGGQRRTKTWREKVYDEETHRDRHAIQQRVWRTRRDPTEAEQRREALAAEIGRAMRGGDSTVDV